MYDLGAVFERLVVMEKEAVASIYPAIDAAAYFPYQQEATPYWLTRLVRLQVESGEDGLGEDVPLDRYTIALRYVAGHLSQGYEGELPDQIYDIIVAVLAYFSDHEELSTTTLGAIDFVDAPGAVITAGQYSAFTNSGIGPTQVGVEFTLDLPLIRDPYPTED